MPTTRSPAQTASFPQQSASSASTLERGEALPDARALLAEERVASDEIALVERHEALEARLERRHLGLMSAPHARYAFSRRRESSLPETRSPRAPRPSPAPRRVSKSPTWYSIG